MKEAGRQADFEHQVSSPILLLATATCLLSLTLYNQTSQSPLLQGWEGSETRSAVHRGVTRCGTSEVAPHDQHTFITNAKGFLKSSELPPLSYLIISLLQIHLEDSFLPQPLNKASTKSQNKRRMTTQIQCLFGMVSCLLSPSLFIQNEAGWESGRCTESVIPMGTDIHPNPTTSTEGRLTASHKTQRQKPSSFARFHMFPNYFKRTFRLR